MDILNEVIESYNAYLDKVPSGAIYIASCLREDKINEALLGIKDFSEGILWLSEANELVKLNDVEVSLDIEKIKSFLIEINEGLERQDYVLVSDIFEYEIAPFFMELEGVND